MAAPAVIMPAIRLWRPRFSYYWMTAAGGSSLAWMFALIAGLQAPRTWTLGFWTSVGLSPISPTIHLDGVSWSFAMAVTTLAVGAIFTEVSKAPHTDWSAWSTGLAAATTALLSVLSGNILAITLSWAAMDVIESIAGFLRSDNNERTRAHSFSTGMRLTGIILLIWAGTAARAAPNGLDLASLDPRLSPILLLTIVLRLGSVSFLAPELPTPASSRNAAVLTRLASAAAYLALLTRIGNAGSGAASAGGWLWAAALLGLGGSIYWVRAQDELKNCSAWLMGSTALAAAAALRGLEQACLAWGIATLLSGGVLFLYNARHRLLRPIVIAGFLGITALPLTPSWAGVQLYSPLKPPLALLLIGQSFLLIGYLRHSMLPGLESLNEAERWVWAIYPLGLAFLPFTQWIIYWWSGAFDRLFDFSLADWLSTWPAAAALLGATLFAGVYRLSSQIPYKLVWSDIGQIRITWAAMIPALIFDYLSRLVQVFSRILEGEGGLLWTFLFVALLVSLFLQFTYGP